MGSWDACCGLSKMPIRCGDEVVDFFIGEVGSFRDSGFICYSNDLWAPITIQTYGEYRDYGEIEPQYGWHTDYVVKAFKECVVELEQGDNQYHDIPVKRDDITYDFIQNAVHEGRLFVHLSGSMRATLESIRTESKAPKTTERHIQVSRMMVHRSVFDELVSWGIDTWSRGKVLLADLVKDGLDAVADVRKEPDEDLRELKKLRFRNSGGDKNIFLAFIRESESGDLYVPHRFHDYLNYLFDEVPAADIEAVVTEMAKFMIFKSQMMAMQFLWSPQTGSQNHAYDELSKFYRFCDAAIQKRRQEDEEEFGFDEDETE